MLIKQLSVFLENRNGSMCEALEILGRNDIDIIALSLADTKDYGILRMIVSDPEKGRSVLREQGLTASLTEVIAVRVAHATGSLCKVMKMLSDDEVNVEYMYAFANGEDASAVMKIDDPVKAEEVLAKNRIKIWTAEEAYQLNRMK